MKGLFRNRFGWVVFLCLLTLVKGYGQTYVIPDSNFRQFLKDSFPSVLDAQGRLIISAAATVTSRIDGSQKNITSLDGIQYFTSATKLYFDRNNLSTLPNLSSITNLQQLSLNSNPMSSIQPLNGFSKLYILRLDSCNFTSIPSLSGLTKLYRFFCRNNKLTKLPDLTGCTSLSHFLCSNNQIDSLPDFSTNTVLGNFSCHGNKIKYVHDYSSLALITVFRCYQNQLTFDDLLMLSKHSYFDSLFLYSPQDSIIVKDHYMVNENDSLKLYLGFDDTLSTNTYYWYKGSKLIATTSSNRYNIYPAKTEDAGTYYCKVKNSARPQWSTFELNTIAFAIDIVPCMFTDKLSYTEIERDCKLGLTLDIDESSISKGIPPFTYKLYNTIKKDTVVSSTKRVNNIAPGKYDLLIIDQAKCFRRVTNFINLQEQAKCDVVITPDGDGKNDMYLLDNIGKVKIYDLNGVLIRNLNGPAYWDGRNDRGELVPMGLYALIMENNQVINITVIY